MNGLAGLMRWPGSGRRQGSDGEPTLPPTGSPDLETQLESLLDCVWRAEADWRFDDRLAMALRQPRIARAA